ncbi:MAG: pyridoxal kinase [Parvibaculum sp.]|uniref:pyridoxal kinase n=1 Tax=Parvibaculum sp. TaxID=2024848 RepID=UPI002850F82C|nr:pyridoxal kinase [Parvibaculum sp.]MDR3498666.1 pyridoxal kinase [Parvibaculum sp.]
MATILSISSQVVYGAVGNTAAAFAMERLGHEVWEVPTVLLAHHPGYGKYSGGPLEAELIESLVAALEEQGWLKRCDAVISGYLAEAGQADAIANAVERVKAANPAALYLCDPIMGDEPGGAYVAPGVEEAVKELSRLADILTPNWFEFGRLAGAQPTDAREALALAKTLGPKIVTVTSAPAPEGRIACLATDGKKGYRTETLAHAPANGASMPKGTGDVFSAILLARLLTGNDLPLALARATGSTAALVKSSVEAGRSELALARDQGLIWDPGLLPSIQVF